MGGGVVAVGRAKAIADGNRVVGVRVVSVVAGAKAVADVKAIAVMAAMGAMALRVMSVRRRINLRSRHHCWRARAMS
jgi:hypothetical protein